MIQPNASPESGRRHGLRKILIGLDRSPEGEAVLEAVRPVLDPSASLLLIHVVPDPAPTAGRQIEGVLRLEEEAEQYLQNVGAKVPGRRVKVLVDTGDPAERILEASREEKADAIVLAWHGHGTLSSLLGGSVAREILRRAGRPVFLVPPAVAASPRPVRRILVPLSRTEGSDSVLATVESLSRRSDARVTLLHVIPIPRVMDPVTGFNPVILEPVRLPEATWLNPLVDLLVHHGVRTEKRELGGEPADVILREGRAEDIDLIALRARDRGEISKLLLGSVTDEVLKGTDRIVLVFPPA
jgi:nucleotide-binding universal stress UspA family protein